MAFTEMLSPEFGDISTVRREFNRIREAYSKTGVDAPSLRRRLDVGRRGLIWLRQSVVRPAIAASQEIQP